MVIEKLMPAGYYTPGLLAAQADIVTINTMTSRCIHVTMLINLCRLLCRDLFQKNYRKSMLISKNISLM